MLYTEEAISKRMHKAQKTKKAISIIAYILLVPLLVYNISLMAQAVANPNKTPSFFGIKTYTIVSGSMEPELQIGDIVIVKETEESNLKKGDVISFRQGQSVVTHRIIEINETDEGKKFVTQGDSNNAKDNEEIVFSMVEGKQIGKIPLIGKISLMLDGKIIILVIAFLIYIYYAHVSKVNGIKSKRRVKRLKYEENDKGE